jgi:phage baseplate assembly protein W
MSNGADRSRQFLGVGIAMSATVDPQGRVVSLDMGLDAQGHIALSSYDDHVLQSILLIVRTTPGERAMRPDFGAGLSILAFEPMGSATAALVQHRITQALTRFEPRIDLLTVDVKAADPASPGQLVIDLGYRVRRTDTIANVVFPFFLERGAV